MKTRLLAGASYLPLRHGGAKRIAMHPWPKPQ